MASPSSTVSDIIPNKDCLSLENDKQKKKKTSLVVNSPELTGKKIDTIFDHNK